MKWVKKYCLLQMPKEDIKKIKEKLHGSIDWLSEEWYGDPSMKYPPDWFIRSPFERRGYIDPIHDIVDVISTTYYMNPQNHGLHAFTTLANRFMIHLVLHDKVSIISVSKLGHVELS